VPLSWGDAGVGGAHWGDSTTAVLDRLQPLLGTKPAISTSVPCQPDATRLSWPDVEVFVDKTAGMYEYDVVHAGSSDFGLGLIGSMADVRRLAPSVKVSPLSTAGGTVFDWTFEHGGSSYQGTADKAEDAGSITGRIIVQRGVPTPRCRPI